MTDMQKVMLSYDEQIEYIKKKGITFDKQRKRRSNSMNIKNFSEQEAKKYLQYNNNFFRLLAYRENFRDKNYTGEYKGLKFSYLVDLARIDVMLRKIVIAMSIDIEHYSKLNLLNFLMHVYKGKPGNEIVEDYCKYCERSQENPFITRNFLSKYSKHSDFDSYTYELKEKYITNNNYLSCPVWVFLEIISFGDFVNFFEFCYDKLEKIENEEIKRDENFLKYKTIIFLLKKVKHVRNAAAHNNCFINNLNKDPTRPNQPNQKTLLNLKLMLARIEVEEKKVGLNEQEQKMKDKIEIELKRALNYDKISNLNLKLASIEKKEKEEGLNEQEQIMKDKIKKKLKNLLSKGKKKINEQDQIMKGEIEKLLSNRNKELKKLNDKNFEDVKKFYREYEQTRERKNISNILDDIRKEFKIKTASTIKNKRRIENFIILLYVHKIIINDKNDTVRKDTCKKLDNFKERLLHKFNYEFNEKILNTFEVIKKAIESWYKTDKVSSNNV